MTNNSTDNSSVNEKDYMMGEPLCDAIWVYGLTELIEEYDSAYEEVKGREPQKADGFLDVISQAAEGFQKIDDARKKQEKVISDLKDDILNLIKEGGLIACGYRQPRDLNDKPIKIPADLFFSGDINWDNSELISQKLEFAGVRLLEYKAPLELNVIEGNFSKNKNAEIKNTKNIKGKTNRNVFELPPETLINEKEAGEFLGISHRTLQKWRGKGDGPKYNKIGRSVKYKIADLIKWRDDNKKRNTSEY